MQTEKIEAGDRFTATGEGWETSSTFYLVEKITATEWEVRAPWAGVNRLILDVTDLTVTLSK
jgi:hypothetical protein